MERMEGKRKERGYLAYLARIAALFPLIALCLAASGGAALAYDGFTDVQRGDWCYWSVDYVVRNGIMTGLTEDTFGPDVPATRGMAVSMLFNAEGRPASPPASFSDVSPEAWYADAAGWGQSTGIAGGYGDGRLGPDDLLTRQQFVTMFYRLVSMKGEGYEGPYAFTPAAPDWKAVSEYARDSVSWMVLHHFMEGDGTPVNPHGQVTRAQAAAMLTRFYAWLADKTVTEQEAVYLGVENYGDANVNEWSKNNFRFRFFSAGREYLYTMDNGTKDAEGKYSYDLQNLLKEGSVYRLTLCREKVTALEPLDGAAVAGTVEALTDSTITVAGRTLPLTSGTGWWRVRTAAGGASVSAERAKTGSAVRVTTRDGAAENVYLVTLSPAYSPAVEGIPGRKTVKNFLATSLMPLGVTLYQFGGGWNWQITAGNAQTASIGVPPEWVSFFRAQNRNYSYKDPGGSSARRNPASSYYPFGMYSEYNYLGADCAGFVGWTLYNTMYDHSGETPFLGSAMAKKLSERGWGSWVQYRQDASTLCPGDVVGISGHVYISLGRCADGSTVIIHSSPSKSRSGSPGGGVQLCAIGSAKTCQAYKLADRYMSALYPTWYSRYAVELKSPSSFYRFGGESWGRFRWNTGAGGILTDPEGYQSMTANQVLKDLFGQ